MTERTVQKEEYAALHNEATSCMRELAQLERACVLGALAVFAWLAAKAELLVGFAGLAWMLPVAIAIYGSLKGLAIRRHLSVLGRYLEELEGPLVAGLWQKHFRRRWAARRWPSLIAWCLFAGLTLVGSTLGFEQFRAECPGPLLNACAQDPNDDGQDGEEGLKQGTRNASGDVESATPGAFRV